MDSEERGAAFMDIEQDSDAREGAAVVGGLQHGEEAQDFNVMAAKSEQKTLLSHQGTGQFDLVTTNTIAYFDNDTYTSFAEVERLSTAHLADGTLHAVPPSLQQSIHEPFPSRNDRSTRELLDMAKGSDGSFRPNNNLSRNPTSNQRVYGKGGRSFAASSWSDDFPATSTNGSAAKRHGVPYKRQKLSHDVPSSLWSGSRGFRDGPISTRLANRLGEGERTNDLRFRERTIGDHYSTPLGSVNEFRNMDDMMKPDSHKSFKALASSPSRSQSQLASSPDELQSPLRSAVLRPSHSVRTTSSEQNMTVDNTARSYLTGTTIPVDDYTDDIEDNEQHHSTAPKSRRSAAVKEKPPSLELHAAKDFLPGSHMLHSSVDELQRDDPEEAAGIIRPTANTVLLPEPSNRHNATSSRSASPVSIQQAIGELSDPEEGLKSATFTKSGRILNGAGLKPSLKSNANKFEKVFELLSFWSQVRSIISSTTIDPRLKISLDLASEPVKFTLMEKGKRWSMVVPVLDTAHLWHSPETAKMFLCASPKKDHKTYWCQIQFSDSRQHHAFYDEILRHVTPPNIVCKADEELKFLLSKARDGRLDEELLRSARREPAKSARKPSSTKPLGSHTPKSDKLIPRMFGGPSSVSTRTRASQKDEDDTAVVVRGLSTESGSPTDSARNASGRSGSKNTPTQPVWKPSKKPDIGKRWTSALVFPEKGTNKATVSFDDLYRLEEDDMLNDNLISFCLRYAQEKVPTQSKRVYIFSSFFYDTLTSNVPKSHKVNYDAVRKWTNKVALFKDYDYVVVPINESYHWYAAIICNTTRFRSVDVQDLTNDGEDIQSSAHVSDAAIAPVISQADGTLPDRISVEHDKVDFGDDAIARETARLSIDGEVTSNHNEPESKDVIDLSASQRDVSPRDGTSTVGAVANEAEKSNRGAHKPSMSAPARRNDRRGATRKREPLEPAIILLDSLGNAHNQTTAKLKEYLDREYMDKMKYQAELPGGNNERRLPSQQNLSDCGVYLIGYVTKFLNDPAGFVEKQAQGTLAEDPDWRRLDPSVMRNNIREIILNEHRAQVTAKSSKSAASAEQVRSSREHPPILPSAYHEFTQKIALAEESGERPLHPDQDEIRQARNSFFGKQRETSSNEQESDESKGIVATKGTKVALDHFASDPPDCEPDAPSPRPGTKRKLIPSDKFSSSSPPASKRAYLKTEEVGASIRSSDYAQTTPIESIRENTYTAGPSKARRSRPIVIEDSQENDTAVASRGKAQSSSPIPSDHKKHRGQINQGVIDLEEHMRQSSERQDTEVATSGMNKFMVSVAEFANQDCGKERSGSDRTPPRDRPSSRRSLRKAGR